MSAEKRPSAHRLKAVVYAGDSAIHGAGICALRDIEEGEYIGTFAGPETPSDGAYVVWVCESDGETKPVGRCGRNPLRYLNHASPNNAQFDGFDLYATGSISCDVEITIDYCGSS
jgi:hypothetical protein